MSTYSSLGIELIGTGELDGTWGTSTNTNLGTIIEQAISGYATQAITNGADTVITIPNGASGVARNMFIECTGALTAARNLIVPASKPKLYFVFNNTSGGFAVTVKVAGQTGVSVPNGKKMVLHSNGTDVFVATNHMIGTLAGNVAGNVTGDVTGNVNGVVTATAGSTAVTPTAGDNGTSIATTAFVQATLQSIYPVGSIYINAGVTTNPATLLGFGTWAAFGAGQVMVGLNGADPLFDALEETGGSKNAIVVSHSHTFSGNTGGQSANHNHGFRSDNYDLFDGLQFGGNASFQTGVGDQTTGVNNQDHFHGFSGTTTSAGSSGTNANLQPYITVAMWKRTA